MEDHEFERIKRIGRRMKHGEKKEILSGQQLTDEQGNLLRAHLVYHHRASVTISQLEGGVSIWIGTDRVEPETRHRHHPHRDPE